MPTIIIALMEPTSVIRKNALQHGIIQPAPVERCLRNTIALTSIYSDCEMIDIVGEFYAPRLAPRIIRCELNRTALRPQPPIVNRNSNI